MQTHSERLNQVLTGWWRRKAVTECQDIPEMWNYWQYTKDIEQNAGSQEAKLKKMTFERQPGVLTAAT
ncbi:MAG: hypothetical protein ACLPPF_12790 [Rhodomicrobium sp.]